MAGSTSSLSTASLPRPCALGYLPKVGAQLPSRRPRRGQPPHSQARENAVPRAALRRVFARLLAADKREAVDVKADDFDGVSFYVQVVPEQRDVLRVSLMAPCFDAVKEAVGDKYFEELYVNAYSVLEPPQPGYNLTVAVNLDAVPEDAATKEELVMRLSTMKRDVVGAPMWVCFKALLAGTKPPRASYVIPYRPRESMYVIPSDDLVVVCYAVHFENHVEQAIAKVFMQEIVISRKQNKDLMTAPSVTFSHEPPHELKQVPGLDLAQPADFIGYVSLAISKRIVEGGRLEKCVTLVEGYRAFLMYHVQATKSQLHTRIRRRASTWLQVLNRSMPEKLNVEKKTIKGRTFNRN